jgi:hypothetical protein
MRMVFLVPVYEQRGSVLWGAEEGGVRSADSGSVYIYQAVNRPRQRKNTSHTHSGSVKGVRQ